MDVSARYATHGRRRGREDQSIMKALLSRTPGGPDTLTLEDIAEPAAGPGQARIVVRACGVNYPDLLIIQDLYQDKPPRPFSPGFELSGVVDAVGTGVQHIRVGDRVLMVLRGPDSEAPAPLGKLGNVDRTYVASTIERIVYSDKIVTH